HFSLLTCSVFLYFLLPGRWAGTRESLGSGQGARVASLDHPPAGTALGRPRITPLSSGAFLLPCCHHEDAGEEEGGKSQQAGREGGNKNDGTLYTPDDLSRHQVTLSPQVCPAETLGCFRLELSVIQFEEGPSLGIAVFRLQRLLDALGSRL
ncbi:hypothetical protein PANDA_017203, partial [Ailuropoda melanoleuca]